MAIVQDKNKSKGGYVNTHTVKMDPKSLKGSILLVGNKYRYVRIVHEGEDYIKVLIDGDNTYEITGPAILIIKTLLARINKLQNIKSPKSTR